MRHGFNNRNGKKVSAGYQNNSTCGENVDFVAQCIDVDAIYSKLKSVLARRTGLEAQYNRTAKVVGDTIRVAQIRQLDRIIDALDQKTYQVNKLLSELTKYSKTHRAMNLAYDYVSREIARIECIVQALEGYILEVEAGTLEVINSRGETDNDTTSLKLSVAERQQQLKQLRVWQSHTARYRVA